MAEPLPCPFCGERLVLYKPRRMGDDFYQHPTSGCVLAVCRMGDPITVFADETDIAAWNRRADVSGVLPQPKASDGAVTKS